MKFFLLIPATFAILFLGWAATGVIDTATDYRTDELEETFNGNTGVGETSVDIQLECDLWQEVLSNASASTNVTDDDPSLSSYDDTNRQVTVEGLSANTTRTITVTYLSAGLGAYPGADDAATKIPTLILVLVAMLVLLVIALGVVLLARQWFG